MLKGATAFVVALLAIAGFDCGIAYSTYAGLGHALPTAFAITLIPLSFAVAVVAGIAAAVALPTRWALILWACFIVPLGIGCFVLTKAMGHSAFALYAVGVMLVLMGGWPLVSFR